MSEEEMQALFGFYPEALENTAKISPPNAAYILFPSIICFS